MKEKIEYKGATCFINYLFPNSCYEGDVLIGKKHITITAPSEEILLKELYSVIDEQEYLALQQKTPKNIKTIGEANDTMVTVERKEK